MTKHFDSSYLIPGTDPQTASWYAGLSARGQDSFELLEDEVVVVDTETTGLDPTRDALIEIAACIMRGPEVVETFQTFVNPGRSIAPEVTELTGIRNEDVAGAPDPSLAVELFAQFADDRNLIAHNAAFDQSFIMRQALPGTITGKWMDSLAMSRIVLPRLRSHRLIDLARAFDLPLSTHRAADDVATTARLWRILLAGAYSLPDGLAGTIAGLSPLTDWPLRELFSQAALALPADAKSSWSLRRTRSRQVSDAMLPLVLEDEEAPVLTFPTDETIAQAFAADGVASSMYANYEPRPEQLDMALEVTEAMRTRTHRVLEAGTGVGKSMAYLLPASLVALANNSTVGVATKTNALMDQLVYSELPRLDRALGGVKYVALKGYEHYPCLRKLESMAADVDEERPPAVIEAIATLLSYTAQTTWGDLDAISMSWYGVPRYAMEASSHDCLKKRCPFFPMRCYLHGARRAAKQADVVVTNHALLFRDVQADNGILPPIKHWIVDEAHAVESEARRQLSHSIGARDLELTLGRLVGKHGTLTQIRRKAPQLEGGVVLVGQAVELESMVGTVQAVGSSFFSFVKDLAGVSNNTGSYSRIDMWISPQVRASGPWATLENPGRSLARKLEQLIDKLERFAALLHDYEELASLHADLTHSTCALQEMGIALTLVIEGSDDSYVYSASIDRGTEKQVEVLEASRLDVGAVLAEEFYPNVDSVIYTSATLATGSSRGPFAYFQRGSGLGYLPAEKHVARQMASSYDFENNMKVLLPAAFPEPNSPSYRSQLAKLLLDIHVAMGGSVLTLFTNRREMEELYYQLKPQLAASGIELIAQTRGSSPKQLRDRFLNDKELSLFALRSFWEGFDAPGDTLRCVVIPKLPFGRPDEPLSREREQREGRSAWNRYNLPEAVMDLKQAAGRLIRNSTDSGFLVLADGRLQTKAYGKTFLAALPTTNIRTLPADEIIRIMGQS